MNTVDSTISASTRQSDYANDASASILKKAIEATKATATALVETPEDPVALPPTGWIGTRIDIKM